MVDTGSGFIAPIRVFDKNDKPIDSDNRFPVDIRGDIEIGAVEIKDGTTDNRAVVTADGALLVTTAGTIGVPVNVYNQLDVPSATQLTLLTYTIPTGRALHFSQFMVGGNSDGTFTIRANGSILAFVRNNAAQRTISITFKNELEINAGNVVSILVYNESNVTRTFEGTINGSLR